MTPKDLLKKLLSRCRSWLGWLIPGWRFRSVENFLVTLAWVIAVGSIACLLWSPTLLLKQAFNPDLLHQMHVETPYTLKLNDYLERLHDYQSAILTTAAGLIGLVGLTFTKSRLDHSREEHRTQRFKDAIEMLGHAQMDVRLGAIYAMQRLMRDSPSDGVAIVNTLAAYARNRGGQITRDLDSMHLEEEEEVINEKILKNYGKTPEQKAISCYPFTDIVAALEVLAERDLPTEPEEKVDFNLDGIDFSYFELRGFNLYEVYLSKSIAESEEGRRKSIKAHAKNFRGADLERVDLKGVNFIGANLEHAKLKRANLQDAYLPLTNLKYAHLEGAKMYQKDYKQLLQSSTFNQTQYTFELLQPEENGYEADNAVGKLIKVVP
jgi:hypothetical protein